VSFNVNLEWWLLYKFRLGEYCSTKYRRHSVDGIPPTRLTEIGTMSLLHGKCVTCSQLRPNSITLSSSLAGRRPAGESARELDSVIEFGLYKTKVKACATLCIADQLINITIFNDIRNIYRIASKISSTLPWSAVNLIPKFHENPVNSPTIF